MANALAIDLGSGSDASGVLIILNVTYSGSDVPNGGTTEQVQVYIDPADQPAAIRSKMSAAIANDAASRGFIVAGGNMTIPAYVKG